MLSEEQYARLAEQCGITVAKFKRKYERGDVELNGDGTARVFSKKELKKLRKAEAKNDEGAAATAATAAATATATGRSDKKRKHTGDGEGKKSKKSKKEKS